MSAQTKSRRVGKQNNAVHGQPYLCPSFVRVMLSDEGCDSRDLVLRHLELIRTTEANDWRPNQTLFLDFGSRQYEPLNPIHLDPVVRLFLERLVESVHVCINFVGHPRGIHDLTEESLAVLTLCPINQIVERPATAEALRHLCELALQDIYPNTEMIFGTHATQILGFLPLEVIAAEKQSVETRLDALNARLRFGLGQGELTSEATIYRGDVGYFSVRRIKVGGTVRRVITFCGDDGCQRTVTHLPAFRKA
jgi:hypothetical protein